jgi:dTDP-4-amino-4,6-dideoxygalactose transaminase
LFVIPLNDFRRQWDDTRGAVLEAVSAVGESGWYILGERVRRFEAALAACWGLRCAVGVASGSDAVEIALRVLGCGPGDKVLTTPLSAFATTQAIVKNGATPVFVDTDPFGLIDLSQCRRALEEHADIRFMVPVHLYGHAVDLNELGKLRDTYGCAIVEDCAQSILATFGGRATGSVGRLAATSFYPTKNLGAMGDGGAVLTDREEDAEAVRCLRDYGQTGKYKHDRLGSNSRLDELQAAILEHAYLPRLARWTARRREIAGIYLKEIRHPDICLAGAPVGCESAWHLFPVQVHPSRKACFMRHLRARGICYGEHYPFVIPEQEALAHIAHVVLEPCTRAAQITRSEVSLPIHPYLTASEVEQVVEACNGWARSDAI